VRGTLLLATLLGLTASMPVWLNTRTFPLLPIFSSLPILPPPFDKILFGTMLLALIAAAWFYRVGVVIFLAASFLAYCGDQNRGQPWLYMYWVMLLLTLLPGPAARAACRCALATVYLWGGIQKCNALFFKQVPGWFVSPAANWHLPPLVLDALRWAASTAPFLEIAIAIGLWFAPSRRLTLAAIVALHLFALLFLGPLGHNFNLVVWPWNLAMIALAIELFPAGKTAAPENPSFSRTWTALRRSKPALAILLPFSLLPILSYVGKWDSAFSFALYSESNANANFFVTQAFADRLPPADRIYLVPYPQYEPQHQGPFMFHVAPWASDEIHVPPISEPRNFRSIYNALRKYANQPEDLRMIVGERGGRVMFYQGDQSWPLPAK